MKRSKHLILGCLGCGSALAEIFFSLAGIKYDREEVNYEEPGPKRDRLLKLNVLGQVPTIVMRDGTILTETLAVAHYVHRLKPELKLIPQNARDFLLFQRWSVFIISSIYPTFTYGDLTDRWVGPGACGEKLRASTDEQRKKLWSVVEQNVKGPYFLGRTPCAIDFYIAVMTNWRPRKEWFEKNCPKLFAIREKIKARKDIRAVWDFNFT